MSLCALCGFDDHHLVIVAGLALQSSSRRMPISSRTNPYPSLKVSSPSLEMVPSRRCAASRAGLPCGRTATGALATSGRGRILRRSREEVFLSTASSLAAKRASGPLALPTAKVVSEFRSQIATAPYGCDRQNQVSNANTSICPRVLAKSHARAGCLTGVGVGTQHSWLIPATEAISPQSIAQVRLNGIVNI